MKKNEIKNLLSNKARKETRFTNPLSLKAHYLKLVENTEEGKQLVEAIANDSRAQALANVWIPCKGGFRTFTPHSMAEWILWYADHYGIERAAHASDTYLTKRTTSGTETLWISGIVTESKIEIVNNLVLTPLEESPDSEDKTYYTQARFVPELSTNNVLPTAAICSAVDIPKSNRDEFPGPELKNRQIQKEMVLLCKLFNLLNGCSCLPHSRALYTPPNEPFGPLGTASASFFPLEASWNSPQIIGVEEIQALREYYSALQNLSEDKKKRILLAISRLGQAKTKRTIEDKILDIGISLEMLLLDDNNNHDQLSLSFRLRGAWFLGNNSTERKHYYSELKQLYSLRSQVAHSGQIHKGKPEKQDQVYKKINDYIHIGELIATKILLDG